MARIQVTRAELKYRVVRELQRRLRARIEAGLATDGALSNAVYMQSQTIDRETGELNVKLLKKFASHRGAPFGNSNRLTHGRRTAERLEFLREIRVHIARSHALVESIRGNKWARVRTIRSTHRLAASRYFALGLLPTTETAT